MRALDLDEMKTGCSALKEWAEHHRFTFHKIKRIMEGLDPAPGDLMAVTIAYGYRVVYTIEQRPLKVPRGDQNFIWVKHLSVSVSNDCNVWPSELAVQTIAEEFGINMGKSAIYMENEDNDNLPSAINLVFEID